MTARRRSERIAHLRALAADVSTTEPERDAARQAAEKIEGTRSYCAGWCGYGCTKEMHDAAVSKAEAIRSQLSPAWTVEVFENMGYHSSVRSPCGRVSVDGEPGTYWAGLSDPYDGGYRWTFDGAATPREAVAAVVDAAKEDLARFGATLNTTGLGFEPLALAPESA